MSSRQRRIQALYEISLAVSPRETLEETADRALAAYLQKLNCSVGAVYRLFDTPQHGAFSLTASIPANPERDELFHRASDHLKRLVKKDESQSISSKRQAQDSSQSMKPDTASEDDVQYTFEESLPVTERVEDVGEYHLMELPRFGVIVLGKHGGTVDPETISALTPLNEQLVQACRSNLTERQLREQRDRFEAMFDAISQPVVNVVVEEGTKRIVRANGAFEETFADEETSLAGQNLSQVVSSDGQSAHTETFVEVADRDTPLDDELQLETAAGSGHFLFDSVPVTASEQAEYFGVYVDITDQKEREQTLEKLYDAAQEFFSEDSQQQVCTDAVETVESVLEHPAVGIHLYRRDTEALEPVAVSEQVQERLDGGPAAYTDRENVVWWAYENEEPVRINDTDTFDGTLPDEETRTRSAVILPIGIHGVLITSAFEARAFDDRDVYFLRLLGQLIEVALDQTVTESGLTAVERAVRSALQADTHEEMAERVLEEIPGVLDVPIAGLWKYQPATQRLQPLHQTAQAAALVGDQPVFPEGDSVAWEAFAEDRTAVSTDVSELTAVHNPETPIKGEITVPIGNFGVLTAASTYKNSFTELDADLLEILATNLEVVAEVINSRRDIDLLDQVIARILRHNVRNKLTPTLGYANTIVENAEEPISGYARKVVDNCNDLEQTAVHAREMREIVQSRDQITTVSLGTVVRSAAASVDDEFPGGELISTIAHTPEVTAHPELGTAIQHLIRNGFDHNDSDTPRVEVVVEQRSGNPMIEIADNGPGIDSFELDVLDEHGESALKHGSGVGLWIVDRVIEYSEALLSFENSTTGATVRITFPSSADIEATD